MEKYVVKTTALKLKQALDKVSRENRRKNTACMVLLLLDLRIANIL